MLANFSGRRKIGYPLLADPDVEIIKTFGIVNTSVPEDNPLYGFSYAGYYMTDAHGVVVSKFFNERNNDRFTSANILVRELGADAGDIQGQVETDHLVLRWSASNAYLRPGQRIVLTLEVEPKPGMHVYSPAVEGGYIPITWDLDPPPAIEVFEAEFPEAEELFLEAIEETLPVYGTPFKILRDIRAEGARVFHDALIGKDGIVVEGHFRYQACDDLQCFFPLEIPLRWDLELKPHDLIRVPEELQRRPQP